jgi:hypothetical protein
MYSCIRACICWTVLAVAAGGYATEPKQAPAAKSAAGVKLSDLVAQLQAKAKILEAASGMKQGFEAFTTAYQLQPGSVKYSDYALARLLFEAVRDAGFWNLHWKITNREPNSDNIWHQWKSVQSPSLLSPTAIAECDELSALYAFLVGRAGVRGMGLFWPYGNHTVTVWMLHPPKQTEIRVVVPTTQIFLSENDFFGSKTFNAWKQKNIYEYTRLDVPDSFEIPKPLADFFLKQVDKYAGASNTALQKIRYLRDDVFLKSLTPEQAAGAALKIREDSGPQGAAEDLAAYWNFAQDMRAQP